MGKELKKLKALASTAGVDVDAIVAELKAEVSEPFVSKLDEAIQGIEQAKANIAEGLSAQVREVRQELLDQVSQIRDGLPDLVQRSATEAINQVVAQYQGQAKQGNPGDNSSGGLGKVLSQLSLPELLEAYRIWKEPTPAEALKSQVNLLLQGMQLGLRLKASPEVIPHIAKTIDQSLG